jgi:hypothetical protein
MRIGFSFKPRGSTAWSRGMLTTHASNPSGSRSTAADTAPFKSMYEASVRMGR